MTWKTRRSQKARSAWGLTKLGVLLGCLTMFLSGCGSIGFASGGGGGGGGGVSQSGDDAKAAGVFDDSSTMKTIQDRGQLIVGTSFDLPPFSSENPVTGSPEGFDIELVKWIATGIFGTNIEGKINYIQLDPRDRELALEQGKVDIVVGRYDISAARKRFVDFGGPYFISHQAVATDPNNPSTGEITALVNLNGRKVCTVRGSTNVDSLKTIVPAADTSMVQPNVAACGAALLNGSVSAIAADEVDLGMWTSSSKAQLNVIDATNAPLPYGVGVKKGVSDLRQFIDDQVTGWDNSTAIGTYLNGVPGDLTKPAVDRY